MESRDDTSDQLVARFLSQVAARQVRGTYALATQSSKTERGGEIIDASSEMVIDGHRIACVGDTVRYPDGTESKVISGAGFALTFKQRPVAIVGSATDNGDKIVSSLQNEFLIQEFVDEPIPGLLDPDYRPEELSAA